MSEADRVGGVLSTLGGCFGRGRRGGGVAASLTWVRGPLWPGDMMMDWVSSRPAGGCGRSFFTGRPMSPAGSMVRLTGCWREPAAVVSPSVDRGALSLFVLASGRLVVPADQMVVSASSPSSVKM